MPCNGGVALLSVCPLAVYLPPHLIPHSMQTCVPSEKIVLFISDKDNDLFFRNAIKIIYKRYDI